MPDPDIVSNHFFLENRIIPDHPAGRFGGDFKILLPGLVKRRIERKFAFCLYSNQLLVDERNQDEKS